MPVRSGMLRVSGETVEGARTSDVFDAIVDQRGDLSVVLLDLRPSPQAAANFSASARRELRRAIEMHEPLHSVVDMLEMQLANHPGSEAAVSILRFSQTESRVEVLNAGMPPIAIAGPGSQMDLHLPLSGPVGRRVGDVHPYELVPLLWGSAWLVVSDGFTGGQFEPEAVLDLCGRLNLKSRGLALTALPAHELCAAVTAVLPVARFVRDDATLLVVAADPSLRLESNGESH